jgi:16S rRNA processing protein RimM
MAAWARVAEITRTRNLEGKLVVRTVDGLPFLLSEGMTVHFVPPTLKGPRHAVVDSIAPLKKDSSVVSFKGLDSVEDVEPLVGSFCLVARGDISHEVKRSMPISWMGFRVIDDQFGPLGVVTEVRNTPLQSLIVVRAHSEESDGHESANSSVGHESLDETADNYEPVHESGMREIMIPLVDEFVKRIDDEQHCIEVSIPEGLLTLNNDDMRGDA